MCIETCRFDYDKHFSWPHDIHGYETIKGCVFASFMLPRQWLGTIRVWPQSFTLASQLRAGSLRLGLSAQICCALAFPRLHTHYRLQTGSVGQWRVCACLGFTLIFVWNPTRDLISCRTEGMDDCTVGKAFNGNILLGCMMGRRKRNYSAGKDYTC